MTKRKNARSLIVWGAISDGCLLYSDDPDYKVRRYDLYKTRREARKTAQCVKRFRLTEEPTP